jgi:hypothetical protein
MTDNYAPGCRWDKANRWTLKSNFQNFYFLFWKKCVFSYYFSDTWPNHIETANLQGKTSEKLTNMIWIMRRLACLLPLILINPSLQSIVDVTYEKWFYEPIMYVSLVQKMLLWVRKTNKSNLFNLNV